MEISHLSEGEPEIIGGPVQESKAQKKAGLIRDLGDRVVTVSEVTFEPGERTNMHYHTYGQVLYVTRGPGFVGTEDEEHEVTETDLIFFAPGEHHWHGSGPDADSSFSHLTYVIRNEVGEDTIAVTEE